jgi:hypothetical protein
MRRAWIAVRSQPWYRNAAFSEGLRAAGFEVLQGYPAGDPKPGDALLGWNRYGFGASVADKFERAGGLVFVAENGYLNADGGSPKFAVHNPQGPRPTDFYALGLGFHNDSTRVPAGGPERFQALGVNLKPWRTTGEHVLVCPNRPFGVPGRSMPVDWAERSAERLRKATRRPVRIREHPGNSAPRRPLEADLAKAWAVVVWSSSVAAHALAAGIPTYIEAPFQILKGAGASGPVNNPETPERLPHFERLAWAQWTCSEIESGEPFKVLLK